MEWTVSGLSEEIEKSAKRAEAILSSSVNQSDTIKANAKLALANIELAKLLIEIKENHSHILLATGYLN